MEGIEHWVEDGWFTQTRINFSAENTTSWHTYGTHITKELVSLFKVQIYISSSMLPDCPEMVYVTEISKVLAFLDAHR